MISDRLNPLDKTYQQSGFERLAQINQHLGNHFFQKQIYDAKLKEMGFQCKSDGWGGVILLLDLEQLLWVGWGAGSVGL